MPINNNSRCLMSSCRRRSITSQPIFGSTETVILIQINGRITLVSFVSDSVTLSGHELTLMKHSSGRYTHHMALCSLKSVHELDSGYN